MSECQGCGSVLEPTDHEINQGVDEILHASLQDSVKHGGICPLCGHSKTKPVTERNSVQALLLFTAAAVSVALAVVYYFNHRTARQDAANDALRQLRSNPQVVQLVGVPLSIQGEIIGNITQDETGWHEIHLTVPVRGPKAAGTIRIAGGRETGPWKFTTLELSVPALKQRADLLTGQVVEYSPGAYEVIHTEAMSVPDYVKQSIPAPSWDGQFPCVFADATPGAAPRFGNCATPMPMSTSSRESVDRFETDLRTGNFVMRQTDLLVNEAGFDLPLTRTYNAQDRMTGDKSHAFGLHANHLYDIAPVGTRNPYTEQYIVLEDGDFLYFPRVSSGTGYSDAVYRHSETGANFYGATQQWEGDGWLTLLRDGSMIHFPESYNAKNMAQGAPTEMIDASGNRIELVRDGKRNLQELQTSRGTAIKFSYDDHDRIVRAEDSAGGWASYAYNADGFLTNVAHSTGTGRHYTYENGWLTWVRDEKGRMLLHNQYSSNSLLMQQDFGNGQSVRYQYSLSNNQMYAKSVTVRFPDGSVKTVEPAGSLSSVFKRTN